MEKQAAGAVFVTPWLLCTTQFSWLLLSFRVYFSPLLSCTWEKRGSGLIFQHWLSIFCIFRRKPNSLHLSGISGLVALKGPQSYFGSSGVQHHPLTESTAVVRGKSINWIYSHTAHPQLRHAPYFGKAEWKKKIFPFPFNQTVQKQFSQLKTDTAIFNH